MSRGASADKERVDGRSPGRPRDSAIDELVLRATIDLLVEQGIDATTIQAVSERTGIARATIYLRWPGTTSLILAALRWAIKRPPMVVSGDIATDLRQGAEQARLTLLQPTFVAAMPAVMRAFLSDHGSAPGLSFDALFPSHDVLLEVFAARAAEQGYRSDVDPRAVVNALLGAMLMHLMTTGKPPTRAFGEQVVDIIIEGTRNNPAE
jgi:AcrR family transcriptional regulator